MKKIVLILVTLFITLFAYESYAAEKEKNILRTPDAMQEKLKSTQDEKNVVSGVDDRDDDSLIKNSDDTFELNSDPDECIL